MTEKQTAAFFRAEGVLVSQGVVHAAAWMAAQRAGMRERAFRFGQAILSAPVFGVLGQTDRHRQQQPERHHLRTLAGFGVEA